MATQKQELADLEPGSPLHHYQIVAHIGRGSTGVVYRACDTQLKRDVAIKVLRPDSKFDQFALDQSLLKEAQSMAALDHPEFVKIFEFIPSRGSIPSSIVMEYLPGISLRKWIMTRPRMQARLRVLQTILHGMASAHRNGIIHCDLKPDNIIIDVSDNAKILDAGFAKLLSNPTSEESPGSLLYMAPEVLRGIASHPGSDVWALGVIAHELLVGGHPYSKSGQDEHAYREFLRTELPQLKISLDKYRKSPFFAQFLAKALHPASSLRFPDAGALLSEFESNLAEYRSSRRNQIGSQSRLSHWPLGTSQVTNTAGWLFLGLLFGLPPDRYSYGQWRSPFVPQDMVYIAGGSFRRGWNKDEAKHAYSECQEWSRSCPPRHFDQAQPAVLETVNSFLIDRCEVTNWQFAEHLNVNRSGLRVEKDPEASNLLDVYLLDNLLFTMTTDQNEAMIRWENNRFVVAAGAERHPVGFVSGYGAMHYCQAHGKELPSELQWEFAARGPENRTYPWGNSVPDCNTVSMARWPNGAKCDFINESTSPVGFSKQDLSPQGVFDLGGNVAEWATPHVTKQNPYPVPWTFLVAKGGSWANGVHWTRPAMRSLRDINASVRNIGFRCTRPL